MRWAIYLTVDGAGHIFTEQQWVLVGRDENAGLRLADQQASRKHCRFRIDPPRLSVEDLASTNGTLVNGQKVAERELSDGDEVRVGDTTMRVAVAPAEFPGYVVRHEIGRGAQGVVFLAQDLRTREPVALKVLHTISPGGERMFLREMDTMRALRHPNIVEFRGGAAEPMLFLASSYCAEGSVDRMGRMPADRAVPIIAGIVDGLAHAHAAELPEVRLADGSTRRARGLVHRDVKPQNVLLANGVPRLADFGLAKAFELAGLSGYTRTGEFGGSVGFMPRAQVLDYRYASPAVDVWAAAATLYWMVTGATPREFPEHADPIGVVLREAPVPIAARVSDVPARLAAVIDAALAEDRPMTAEEFAEALKGAW